MKYCYPNNVCDNGCNGKDVHQAHATTAPQSKTKVAYQANTITDAGATGMSAWLAGSDASMCLTPLGLQHFVKYDDPEIVTVANAGRAQFVG